MSKTHGQSGSGRTPEYSAWKNMISRCAYPKHVWFKNYGGRGIGVCDEWRSDFPAFLASVGKKPSPQHQLDRIDNEKGYQPGNVKWSTPLENSANRRASRFLEWNGRRETLSEWSRITGIKVTTICQRLNAYGWEVGQALTVQPRSAR